MPVRSASVGQRDAPLRPRTLRSRGPTRSSAAPIVAPSWGPLHSRFPETATIVVEVRDDRRTLVSMNDVRRSSGRRRRRRPVRGPGAGPRPPRASWWSTRASPATRPPPTCRASCPATACRPRSCWRPAATRWPATAAQLVGGTVTDVRPRDRRRLRGAPGRRPGHLRARRVLVATGLRDELPDLPGVRERWGRDLLHCPYCHGYEVRDQPLGVLGGTPDAVQHALLVRQWSADVVFFTPHQHAHRRRARAARRPAAIGIVDGPVGRLVVEDDRLHGVELADGRVVRRDGRVRPARLRPRTTTCSPGSAARRDENGWVVADPTGRTTRARRVGGGQRRRTRGPRSSPPPARVPPPPSPSTPTWSRRTCTPPFATSAPASPPDPVHPATPHTKEHAHDPDRTRPDRSRRPPSTSSR